MANDAPNLVETMQGQLQQPRMWSQLQEIQATILNGPGLNPLEAQADALLRHRLLQQQQQAFRAENRQNLWMPTIQVHTRSGLSTQQAQAVAQAHFTHLSRLAEDRQISLTPTLPSNIPSQRARAISHPLFIHSSRQRAEDRQRTPMMAPTQASPERLHEYQNKVIVLRASIEHEEWQLMMHRAQNRDAPSWAEVEHRHVQSLFAKRQMLPQMVQAVQEIAQMLGVPISQHITQGARDRSITPDTHPLPTESVYMLNVRIAERLAEQRHAKEEAVYKTEYTHPKSPEPGFTFDFALDEKSENLNALPVETSEQVATVLQLQCARCHEPLVGTSSGVFAPDEQQKKRAWALHCGHVVDGECMVQIGHGDSEESEFMPMLNQARSNTAAPQSISSSFHFPVQSPNPPEHVQQMTGASSSSSRKRKRGDVEAERVYSCPVEGCGREHVSWKVKDEWVPANNGKGAIAMFV